MIIDRSVRPPSKRLGPQAQLIDARLFIGTVLANRRPSWYTAIRVAATTSVIACNGGQVFPGREPFPGHDPNRVKTDATTIYEEAGLVAAGAPVPFTGSVRYLAGKSPDSTLVLVMLSLPTNALTFVRDSDRYRAGYTVSIDVKDTGDPVRTFEVRDVVRVSTSRETGRTEESVIFQQFLSLAPGPHRATLTVRDVEGSRNSSRDFALFVPRFHGAALSSPVPVYEARGRQTIDSLPRLLANPRATVVFGRDSAIAFYIEAYGRGSTLHTGLRFTVRSGTSTSVAIPDTTVLTQRGTIYAGNVLIPVSRMGVGLATVLIWRSEFHDTVTAPVFVSFGENLPVVSFEEMLNYLRYYTTPERLRSLRDTAPEYRAGAWSEFVRQTDPVLSTPEHEGLRDYFTRLQRANDRFREEGIPGWQTDRGAVFITLGEPDQVFEQQRGETSQRGRVQIWEYSQFRVQLVFVDQSGFSRWRLTGSSEAEFRSLARRILKG